MCFAPKAKVTICWESKAARPEGGTKVQSASPVEYTSAEVSIRRTKYNKEDKTLSHKRFPTALYPR